jgi:hypothetical protein
VHINNILFFNGFKKTVKDIKSRNVGWSGLAATFGEEK